MAQDLDSEPASIVRCIDTGFIRTIRRKRLGKRQSRSIDRSSVVAFGRVAAQEFLFHKSGIKFHVVMEFPHVFFNAVDAGKLGVANGARNAFQVGRVDGPLMTFQRLRRYEILAANAAYEPFRLGRDEDVGGSSDANPRSSVEVVVLHISTTSGARIKIRI